MSERTALVVEDEFIIAMELEDRLARTGFRVVGHAATGESAIAKARDHRPDVVLMDIRLAGALDGIDAARVIGPELDIPVVFITANDDPETRERATTVRRSRYLTKPFNDKTLQETIAQLLDEC
jgi:CheY-like chemotaxis protein